MTQPDPATLPDVPQDAPRGGRLSSALGIFLVGIWFGMLTGWLELVNITFKRHVLGDFVLLGRHTIWMAPLANVALMLLLAFPLALMAAVGRSELIQRIAVFTFSFTLMLSLALLHSEIHVLAAIALAAGLGIHVVRVVAGRRSAFSRTIRRTVGWMCLACVVLAVLVPAGFAWRERAQVTSLPQPQAGSPNVLLIVWDTVRSKSLSTYGYERDTSPHLTRVAQDGVRFARPLTTAPWTLPSHASMFTGRWANEMTATWDVALDDSDPTLAEQLQEHGYVTAGFVANQAYCSREHGLDRGFMHFEDFSELPVEFVLSAQLGRQFTESRRVRALFGWQDYWGRKSADRINDEFLDWLDHKGERPFFVFLNYYDAHDPYLPPAPYDTRFGPKEPRERLKITAYTRRAETRRRGVSPEQIESQQNAYDGAIALLDDALKSLLRELADRNQLDDTVVIVTSDHGDQFGEHGLLDHGNSLYRPLIQVPLVIRFPKRVPAGAVVENPISLRDLPATILELTGTGSDSAFPGQSLSRHWVPQSQGDPSQVIFSSLRPKGVISWDKRAVESVISDGYQYIKMGSGREEMYDFWSDPDELNDLVSVPDKAAVLDRLRQLSAEQHGSPSHGG